MTVNITLNGEARHLNGVLSIRDLLLSLDLDPRKIAVERNLEIVPRSKYEDVTVENGDKLEIVHFIGGGAGAAERTREGARPNEDATPRADKPFVVAGKEYRSRLIIGTGKFKNYAENAAALEASGAEIVTVAVRRVNLSDPGK